MDDVIPLKQWLARTGSTFFSRPVEAGMMLRQPLEIGSVEIIKTLAPIFEPFSRDANYINFVSRKILVGNVPKELLDEADVYGAETKINEQFRRVNDWFDGRLKQAARPLEEAGFDVAEILAARTKQKYEAVVTTRWGKDMLELAVKADDYHGLVHFGWMMSENPDRGEDMAVKLNSEREIRQQFFSLTKLSARHFTIIHRICREVQRLRGEERQAQSERDKAAFRLRQKSEAVQQAQVDQEALQKKAPRKPRPPASKTKAKVPATQPAAASAAAS